MASPELKPQLHWPDSACPEALASPIASALRQRVSEDVWILAIVVVIGKLVEVQRHVLPADVVIGSHDAGLQQAPERVEVVGVNYAVHIFASTANVSVLSAIFAQLHAALGNLLPGGGTKMGQLAPRSRAARAA